MKLKIFSSRVDEAPLVAGWDISGDFRGISRVHPC